MRVIHDQSPRTIKTKLWRTVVTVVVVAMTVVEVAALNGPNVCMVKQKYNITKRVKYRAPMSVRTYEWCFSMPPRCSRWSTEMRDLTRLETEERTAEVAICCPGYKMKDVSCIPICPNGKTGAGCSEDCPSGKWGPNCVNDCVNCTGHGICSPVTGECLCHDGWQGESCEFRMSTTQTSTLMIEEILTTTKSTTKTSIRPTNTLASATHRHIETTTSPITSSSTSRSTTLSTTSNVKMTSTYPVLSTTSENQKNIIQLASTKKSNNVYRDTTLSTPLTVATYKPTTQDFTNRYIVTNSDYNRTELPLETTKSVFIITQFTTPIIGIRNESTSTIGQKQTPVSTKGIETKTSPTLPTYKEITSKRPETTVRFYPTTIKFKPKEIWIKPAQKGESSVIESRLKLNHESSQMKHKTATKKETTSTNTTPRTIIVSIIPTSISYSTFKKIALTTASYLSQKINVTNKSYNRSTDQELASTPSPFTVKILNATFAKDSKTSTTINPLLFQNITKPYTLSTINGTKNVSTINPTNSMTSTSKVVSTKLNSSNSLTTISSSALPRVIFEISPSNRPAVTASLTTKSDKVTHSTTEKVITNATSNKQQITVNRNVTVNSEIDRVNITGTPTKVTKTPFIKTADVTNSTKRNFTNLANRVDKTVITTDDPSKDEETFHILTEPEHITAVMGEKGAERSTVDLVSVLSIAGGVMMAVITVAVVIVMIERCRRPRYEDVRKMNDIRMQVMIDNNDVPPPYVRSIFHTPLPDPPTSEKCHYQPISTLDRNLKQFMRPVVVQTISPIMLENFRGILECHYDHLPRRSQDFGTMRSRCSVAPSVDECMELRCQRATSVTESTIEALKCEAKLDVIDNTTSEPLYAEIPCWRPPSEHAIEIININGEAVTEL